MLGWKSFKMDRRCFWKFISGLETSVGSLHGPDCNASNQCRPGQVFVNIILCWNVKLVHGLVFALYVFTITISKITTANIVKIFIRLMDFWFFNLSLYVLVVAAFATYLIIDTKVILQTSIFSNQSSNKHISGKGFQILKCMIMVFVVFDGAFLGRRCPTKNAHRMPVTSDSNVFCCLPKGIQIVITRATDSAWLVQAAFLSSNSLDGSSLFTRERWRWRYLFKMTKCIC